MNVGREPWGFSLNAEVWNGRIAMLAFFWVLIQEAIVGKGSITVFQEAEHWWQLIVPSIIGGTFFVMVAFVTNTIASQDGDDFSTDEILAELTGEKPTTKAPAGQQEKEIEEDGEKDEEMHEKYMCYCETNSKKLADGIAELEAKIPQIEASIKEALGSKAQLEADLAKHKKDREDAKAAIDSATAQREKENGAFTEESTESKANIAA